MVSAGYTCNAADSTLERYYQESTDFDSGAPGRKPEGSGLASDSQSRKQVCLKELSECSFSYSDGQVWKAEWDEALADIPRMIKINFKFKKDTKGQEFLVNIPISP